MQLKGNIVDIENNRIYPGEVIFENGKITAINELEGEKFDSYILPGFVDAHVHVESSMLIPSEFARIAVTHGTVSTVNDPHEIANVIGIEGVKYMIENGKKFHSNSISVHQVVFLPPYLKPRELHWIVKRLLNYWQVMM